MTTDDFGAEAIELLTEVLDADALKLATDALADVGGTDEAAELRNLSRRVETLLRKAGRL